MITALKLIACIAIASLIIGSTSETEFVKYATALTFLIASISLAVGTFTLP
jgi:hypothetical protein